MFKYLFELFVCLLATTDVFCIECFTSFTVNQGTVKYNLQKCDNLNINVMQGLQSQGIRIPDNLQSSPLDYSCFTMIMPNQDKSTSTKGCIPTGTCSNNPIMTQTGMQCIECKGDGCNPAQIRVAYGLMVGVLALFTALVG